MRNHERRIKRLEAHAPRRAESLLLLRTIADTGEPLRASWPGGELWAEGESLAAFRARAEAIQGALPPR